MRAVLQRVRSANVTVGGEVVGRIDAGWLVLLGVGPADTDATAAKVADRIAGVRAFADDAGKMNRSVRDIGGAVLLVSNFTLYGDLSQRRPGFGGAARPEAAAPLVEAVARELRALGVPVAQGRFGADMQVELVNDGPVTFVIDTDTRAS